MTLGAPTGSTQSTRSSASARRAAHRTAARRHDATPGEVLVAVRRVGICGTDYHIFEGKHPFLQYPRVMGHELAVEVLEAPADAGIAPGEICAVNPYLSCGTCVACRNGKPNCCVRIAVLGVHRDGGMTELLVAAGRQPRPRRRPERR